MMRGAQDIDPFRVRVMIVLVVGHCQANIKTSFSTTQLLIGRKSDPDGRAGSRVVNRPTVPRQGRSGLR